MAVLPAPSPSGRAGREVPKLACSSSQSFAASPHFRLKKQRPVRLRNCLRIYDTGIEEFYSRPDGSPETANQRAMHGFKLILMGLLNFYYQTIFLNDSRLALFLRLFLTRE